MYMHDLHALARKSKEAFSKRRLSRVVARKARQTPAMYMYINMYVCIYTYIHTYVNIYMLIRPQCQTIALSGLEFVGVSRVNVEYWLHECFTSMRV